MAMDQIEQLRNPNGEFPVQCRRQFLRRELEQSRLQGPVLNGHP